MKTVKFRIKTEQGKEERCSLTLIEDFGIEDDAKASGGDRQLCLCDDAAYEEYISENRGLCVTRFMPNITTAGLDYKDLRAGDCFRINGTEIEITGTAKKCFPECEFVQSGTVCQIKRTVAFAKIRKGGTINIGDEIADG